MKNALISPHLLRKLSHSLCHRICGLPYRKVNDVNDDKHKDYSEQMTILYNLQRERVNLATECD